jgi:hypothetical protein
MHIEISGTAQVRHSRSGLIYEIESDELEWHVEGNDEGQMGGRNRWYAEVQHYELGTLVWTLWEYPEGAEEYQNQDLNGHVLVKDFDIYLAHDPEEFDGANDVDGPTRYRSETDDVGVTADELRALPPEEQAPYLTAWFLGLYWDPANEVSYNSREGGYLWNYGGPYSAEKELRDEFEAIVGDEAIGEAVGVIESDGIFDWSPRPDHPNRLEEGWDGFERPQSELEEQIDVALAQLRMARQPQFGSFEELEARERVTRAFNELAEELGPEEPEHGGPGHNRPPADERFTNEEIDEMRAAASTAIEALDGAPDALEVVRQASTLVRIAKNAALRSGELFDKFLDKVAENAGAVVGKALGLGLLGALGWVLLNVQNWISLIL